MNEESDFKPLQNELSVGSRKLKHGIGFKLTIIVSIFLFLVFAAKAGYDAYFNYVEEIAGYTQISIEENKVLAKEIEALFVDVESISIGVMSLIETELSLSENNRDRDRLVEYLKLILQRHSKIHGLGIFLNRMPLTVMMLFLKTKIFTVLMEDLFLM